MPVNRERIIKEFKTLTEFDSETYHEKNISEYLIKRLKDLGLEVKSFDESQNLKKYSTSIDLGKNIIATLKGDIEGSVLFLAHQDTVSPGNGKKALFNDDVITSDGNTVLGADDISGLVSIIEALEVIIEDKIPHKTIEVFFPIAEEAYAKGSKVFDYSNIISKEAYVFDLTGDIGEAAIEAPLIISFKVKIYGKSAHSGFNPEMGVDAIKIASNAISKIKTGRIDSNTTLNFGLISGGLMPNIVSDYVLVSGELRSCDEERGFDVLDNIKEVFTKEAKALNGRIELIEDVELHSYKISLEENVIKTFDYVCKKEGIKTKYIKTFGGSDNNNLVYHGIRGIVIASGYKNPHTKEERSNVLDLIKVSKIAIGLAGGINENN